MISGKIKGYKICNITKKSIEKENYINDLKKLDSNIKEEIVKVLENKGYVYGLEEKNLLKAVYLFDSTKDNEKKVMAFNKSLYTEDVKDKIDEFEKIIIEELKELVNWGECSKVIWNDIEIEPNNVSSFSITTLSTCISLGLLYGIVFNNLAMGLLFGVAIWSSGKKKKIRILKDLII